MRILTLNLLSGSTWSARIARNIGTSCESHSYVWYASEKNKNEEVLYSSLPMSFLYYFWVALNFFFEIFTPWKINHKKLLQKKEYVQTDIIHMHTIQWWYFDYRDLPQISLEKKIIWTLHDDWFCAGNDKDHSLFPYKTKLSFIKRKEVLQNTNIDVVAVSEWMYQKAIKSQIFPENKIHKIQNWIDTNIFFQKDKLCTRRELWISEDIFMVVSIAWAGRKSKAKWIQYVEKLANELSDNQEIQFWTLGNKKNMNRWNLHEISFISQHDMALYFSAADVFLYPTMADSFGLVIAESIACGCPVVTFDVWATSELVIDWKTWYLVPLWDYFALKKWLLLLRENPIRVTKNSIPFDISLDRMMREYMNLYKSLI